MQQLRPWVWQIVAESEARCKAFTISTIEERIAMVDARVDAFEARVKKRLVEAQPSDLSAFYEELKKFKADFTSSLAAPVIVPDDTSSKPLFNLFASEDHTHLSHGKRPFVENDGTEERYVYQKTSEVDEEEAEDVLG